MYGYSGKVLRINLTDKTVDKTPLDYEAAKKYIGSRGLGVKTFVDEVDPKVDPLSPDNKFIIAAGPLTGANVPASGRYNVITKSPLTGTIFFSNSGGFWGPKLKAAGYDMIIIEGKADEPVYINIDDDTVEIHDAKHLWGKVTSEVTSLLNTEYPKSKVLCIGPAGENLSKIAAVMNDVDRACGRGGVGAVLGSKNLKAIVVNGSQKVDVPDLDKLKVVNLEKVKKLKDDPVAGGGLPTYGTAVLVNIINESGVHPVQNFQEAYTPEADKISGEAMTEKTLVTKTACFRCPIACGRKVKLDDDREVGGPEYETIWSYGSNCAVYDLQAINLANEMCNEMGLDTISAGATIATAMELFQRGYIKPEEIEADGLSLNWGDPAAIVGWTKKMGLREGFASKMADGAYRLCEEYDATQFAMTSKKQELPAYDPRGVQGHGLNYATSNRGGCHIKGYMINPEILGYPVKLDRLATDGKAEVTKVFHDLTAVIDSLGLCVFTVFGLGTSDYTDMYNAVCGDTFTDETLLEAGERIWNLEKVFNLRAGFTKEDDTLPKRLLEEPIPEGPSKGSVHQLAILLPEYYAARGWTEDGIPTEEVLKKLDLEHLIGTF